MRCFPRNLFLVCTCVVVHACLCVSERRALFCSGSPPPCSSSPSSLSLSLSPSPGCNCSPYQSNWHSHVEGGNRYIIGRVAGGREAKLNLECDSRRRGGKETRGGETGGGERKIFRVEGNSPNCRWISSLESLSKRKLANFIPPPVLASRKRRERCTQTHKEESTKRKEGRILTYCYSPYSRNVCQPLPFLFLLLPLLLLIPSFSPLQVSFSRYRCHVAKNVHAKGEDRKENKKDRQSFSLSFLSPLQFLCDLVEDTKEVFFYLFRRCLVASGDKMSSCSDPDLSL